MPPILLFSNGWAEPTPFLPSSLPQKSLHSGVLQLSSPSSGTQEVLPTPVERKYSTGSSLLTSSSIILTYLPFYTAPLAVAHLFLTSLAPFSLALSCTLRGASEPGFWSPTNSSICPSPLWSFAPTSGPFLQFSESLLELHWLSLSFCRGILVSFSFLCCCCSLFLSGTECGQIFHFFWPHQTPF